MRCFQKRPELVTGDEGDILPSTPMNEDGLAAVCNLIEQGLEIRACARVSRLGGHRSLPPYMYRYTVLDIPEKDNSESSATQSAGRRISAHVVIQVEVTPGSS